MRIKCLPHNGHSKVLCSDLLSCDLLTLESLVAGTEEVLGTCGLNQWLYQSSQPDLLTAHSCQVLA